jgi:hypothetical protein
VLPLSSSSFVGTSHSLRQAQLSMRHSKDGSSSASRAWERHSATETAASSWPGLGSALLTVHVSLCHHLLLLLPPLMLTGLSATAGTTAVWASSLAPGPAVEAAAALDQAAAADMRQRGERGRRLSVALARGAAASCCC